jgi:hypothetical protein
MNLAMILAAISYLEQYGPLLVKVPKGVRLVKEMTTFVREHRDVDGLTDEDRARADAVLAKHPRDVKL